MQFIDSDSEVHFDIVHGSVRHERLPRTNVFVQACQFLAAMVGVDRARYFEGVEVVPLDAFVVAKTATQDG